MVPYTLTVGLIVSGCTIKRSPFGRTVTVGLKLDGGTRGAASTFCAHSGRATDLTSFGAKDSPPPNPLEATGFPDGLGVRIAVSDVSLTRNSFATRFTSATVTFWIARISSSGELRLLTASASDQTEASPEMEFF